MAGGNRNNGYVLTDEETKISFGLTLPLIMVLVCNLYFYILLQPYYSTLIMLPSTSKTSVVYLLQQLEACSFCFILFFLSQTF